MGEKLDQKVESLLKDTGYFDLELQHRGKTGDGKNLYEYFGYSDADMSIHVLIDEKHVEVTDCYLDENNYVQSVKITVGELMRNY